MTWPQGNGWLTQQLAKGLASRWQAGHVALKVDEGRHEVSVLSWSAAKHRLQPWLAKRVILAVPLFVAQRLLAKPVAALDAIVPKMAYAPWLVSNVLLKQAFRDRPGAPLAWDNVPYAKAGAGASFEPSLAMWTHGIKAWRL